MVKQITVVSVKMVIINIVITNAITKKNIARKAGMKRLQVVKVGRRHTGVRYQARRVKYIGSVRTRKYRIVIPRHRMVAVRSVQVCIM